MCKSIVYRNKHWSYRLWVHHCTQQGNVRFTVYKSTFYSSRQLFCYPCHFSHPISGIYKPVLYMFEMTMSQLDLLCMLYHYVASKVATQTFLKRLSLRFFLVLKKRGQYFAVLKKEKMYSPLVCSRLLVWFTKYTQWWLLLCTCILYHGQFSFIFI